eukprot:638891-Rhodomonas_salina.1
MIRILAYDEADGSVGDTVILQDETDSILCTLGDHTDDAVGETVLQYACWRIMLRLWRSTVSVTDVWSYGA